MWLSGSNGGLRFTPCFAPLRIAPPRPMAASPRILLCGDVVGRLDQLYKRFAAVNKSAGPFDVLLCVGQFFPQSSEQLDQFMNYVEGRVEIPIATYFIGDFGAGAPKVLTAASKAAQNQGFKMDGLKISDNLYWLKGSGKFQLHGLSVAYLSGRRSSIIQPFGTYSQDDVDALRAMAEEPEIVDIFLTNEWPSGVTNKAVESGIPPGVSDSSGFDSTVAELVSEIKPRYHVAGAMGVFYAREPYINVDSSHVTRFLGLAPVGNKDKQKFIHAISPTPASVMSAVEMCKKPPNASLSPYIDLEKISQADLETKRPAESDLQYWRYDVSQKRQKTGAGDAERRCFKYVSSGSCPRGDKCHFVHDNDAREQYLRGVCFDFINKGKCEKGPDCSFKHSFQDNAEDLPKTRTGNGKVNRSKECWFCLSSPNIESHLIISIGDSFYCALPKGPLLEDHVLVVPIEHAPNTLSIPSESETELQKFLSSLKAYYKNLDKEMVWFEWIYRRGTHANLQVVPIPSSRVSSVKDIFILAAEKLGFKFKVTESRKLLRAQFDANMSLFYVELPCGTVLSHTADENEKFPAQFGREVLAGLLNMADRADWRKCTSSKEEEMEMASRFKKKFEAYDPNQ